MPSFIQSIIYSFIHSFSHFFIHSINHVFIYSFIHSFICTFLHSFNQSYYRYTIFRCVVYSLSTIIIPEVILECAGISQPLFVLTGCCHGLDIKLDSEAIPFGSVTIGSSSSRKLIMYNNGDVGAAFCWNIEKFKPDFVISPVKGYIAAGMEVTFEVTFTPTNVHQDIRYDVSCTL